MKLDEHIVGSSSSGYSRHVWLTASALDEPRKLCVFLDAEYYLDKMDMLPTLFHLQADGSVPPLACLFVSHLDSAARHADYTCNPRFTDFIANDVVGWARAQNKHITASGNVICGLSLSGLASAYLCLTNPNLFSYALCQSGSFWWNEQWLSGQVRALFSKPAKFWMSVGDKERETGISYPPSGMRQDVSQVEAVKKMSVELRTLGCDVNHHLFSGGHELEPWKKEVPAALKWLIGNQD